MIIKKEHFFLAQEVCHKNYFKASKFLTILRKHCNFSHLLTYFNIYFVNFDNFEFSKIIKKCT